MQRVEKLWLESKRKPEAATQRENDRQEVHRAVLAGFYSVKVCQSNREKMKGDDVDSEFPVCFSRRTFYHVLRNKHQRRFAPNGSVATMLRNTWQQ